MLPDLVSNPGPMTYEAGALPIALPGPAHLFKKYLIFSNKINFCHLASDLENGVKVTKV